MATCSLKSLRRPSLTLISGARKTSFRFNGLISKAATRGLATVTAQTTQPAVMMEDHNTRLINMGLQLQLHRTCRKPRTVPPWGFPSRIPR
uniref:Uncharacterized protein n=1 Tax=Fusarium oxysporum (strain Fo5176) TaxID=660025 RepID=A0A0D2Y2F1_FUSOF